MSWEINRWSAAALWVGVVERTLEPGIPQRIIPVILGGQNLGKSSAVAAMLPKELADYTCSQLDIFGDKQRFVDDIRGIMLAECAELVGATKADARNFKARIGPGSDRHRLLYTPNPVNIPRTVYIIGTANGGDGESPYPEDSTGTTRFVPIQVGVTQEELRAGREPSYDVITRMRDKCWAAAFCLYKSGFSAAFLPRELVDEQEQMNQQYIRKEESLTEVVTQWLERTQWEGDVPLAQVIEVMGLDRYGFNWRNNMVKKQLKDSLLATGVVKSFKRRVNHQEHILWRCV